MEGDGVRYADWPSGLRMMLVSLAFKLLILITGVDYTLVTTLDLLLPAPVESGSVGPVAFGNEEPIVHAFVSVCHRRQTDIYCVG